MVVYDIEVLYSLTISNIILIAMKNLNESVEFNKKSKSVSTFLKDTFDLLNVKN